MKRRNIFEIINENNNPLIELKRINNLLNDNKGVYVYDDILSNLYGKGQPTSIISYIDNYLFKSWKQRGTCINCQDMRNTLNIDMILDSEDISIFDVLKYCEYAINLIYLLQEQVRTEDYLTDTVEATKDNVLRFLGYYNYEVQYFQKQSKAIVVLKNAQSTAVAEIVSDSLAYSIIEYNHYLLKGNINKKKDILLALGTDLEPHRAKIKELDKDLEDNIFFMLNNLNLRHNNRKKGDKCYNEKVGKMRKAELEEWYDELYQLILIAYLQLDNIDRNKKIKQLKREIKEYENGQTQNADKKQG